MEKDAFKRREELLTRSIRVDLRKRLVKTLVWPVVLYGCETWAMRKEEINRLNAFEMWVWRRMGKVSWMDKRTNEQVLSSMNEKRSLIKTIWDRKKNWIGHVVRGDGLMKLVLKGIMEEERPRGRPRMGMIDDVLDETYGDMKRKAENRENLRIWKPRTCGPWLGLGGNCLAIDLGLEGYCLGLSLEGYCLGLDLEGQCLGLGPEGYCLGLKGQCL